MPDPNANPFFFKCSVSEDLYGACLDPSGDPLPTPGGGTWLPVDSLDALGAAAAGFNPEAAERDIARWDNHWFTSNGRREIWWGPDGPPEHLVKRMATKAPMDAEQ